MACDAFTTGRGKRRGGGMAEHGGERERVGGKACEGERNRRERKGIEGKEKEKRKGEGEGKDGRRKEQTDGRRGKGNGGGDHHLAFGKRLAILSASMCSSDMTLLSSTSVCLRDFITDTA